MMRTLLYILLVLVGLFQVRAETKAQLDLTVHYKQVTDDVLPTGEDVLKRVEVGNNEKDVLNNENGTQKHEKEYVGNYELEKRDGDEQKGDNGGYTFDLESHSCHNDSDCNLVNFDIAYAANSPIVKKPFCANSTYPNGTKYCACPYGYCVSRSTTSTTLQNYYYCGPCGRIGTQCKGTGDCSQALAECTDGICGCENDGTFYDIYYCIIPYDGYERAIQVAIATCIFVSVCLLLATIYSTMYRQGRVHPYLLRILARSQTQGTRESPPGDTPPKYDDIMAEDQRLPTYQEALNLDRENRGSVNPAYDAENASTSSGGVSGTGGGGSGNGRGSGSRNGGGDNPDTTDNGIQSADTVQVPIEPVPSTSSQGVTHPEGDDTTYVSCIVSDRTTGAITKRRGRGYHDSDRQDRNSNDRTFEDRNRKESARSERYDGGRKESSTKPGADDGFDHHYEEIHIEDGPHNTRL